MLLLRNPVLQLQVQPIQHHQTEVEEAEEGRKHPQEERQLLLRKRPHLQKKQPRPKQEATQEMKDRKLTSRWWQASNAAGG